MAVEFDRESVKCDLKKIFADAKLCPRIARDGSQALQELVCSDAFLDALVECQTNPEQFVKLMNDDLMQAEVHRVKSEDDIVEKSELEWKKKYLLYKEGKYSPQTQEEVENFNSFDNVEKDVRATTIDTPELQFYRAFNSFLFLVTPKDAAWPSIENEPEVQKVVAEFENNFKAIRDEFIRACGENADNVPPFSQTFPHHVWYLERGRTEDPWRSLWLRYSGQDIDENRQKCPFVAELLDKLRNEVSTSMFSCLPGGRSIPLHHGWFKGQLRVHLGLIVPSPEEGYLEITCGSGRSRWTEGKCIIFDDNYMHSVRNETNKMRVILWADVMRHLPHPYLRHLNQKAKDIYGSSYISKMAQADEKAQVNAEKTM